MENQLPVSWMPNFLACKPLKQQLADVLIRTISVQNLNSDYYLPEIGKLSTTYKVSRDVVFEAYHILMETGIVRYDKSRSKFVLS
ncbi:GntR family transcriptional regulator [Mucilaginibacter aquatilis]|uniref:GntR family transcriptional regulator n=1 Tax=Mucilaginibacter aquatilis TaxID=1517760 RepID=A0A6I4IRK4_9SPHI|nr:GntR family transcriptional regulator [Mucilaginibacter aquatilis]